jgi:hypothetical protein
MAALQNAPLGVMRELAWQMFLDLSAPATPARPELAGLRSQYLGMIGNLLAAAPWESNTLNANPGLVSRSTVPVDCTSDTDYDGHPECMLSDERFFALLDPEGGRLVLLFGRDAGGVIELVGPTSQFVVGLSDYRQWDLSAGPLADPANIPGAFAGPWVDYQIERLDGGVRFFAPGVEKLFQLTESGLRVEVQTEQTQGYQIPLAMAPQTRFTPGWVAQYQESEIPQGWVWGIRKGSKVEIRSSGNLNTQNFQESQPFLAYPENPNRDYGPGHFLPFPIDLVTIPPQSDFWVEITWLANPPPDR